jgi:hypothetical protein
MQTELEIQTQEDAERELDEKLWMVYRQNGGKLKPFFDRLRAIEDAQDEACVPRPEMNTLAARVKTKQ